MTKHSAATPQVMDPLRLAASLAEITARTQRLTVDFLTRRPDLSNLGDPAGIGRAFLDLTAKMMSDPVLIANAQIALWADLARLWQHATSRLFGADGMRDRSSGKDRRFQHPAWTEHFVFYFISPIMVCCSGGNCPNETRTVTASSSQKRRLKSIA